MVRPIVELTRDSPCDWQRPRVATSELRSAAMAIVAIARDRVFWTDNARVVQRWAEHIV
jgi:hypothetical protein